MTTVYDNLKTMRREWWRAGRCVASISAEHVKNALDVNSSRRWGSFPDKPA